MPNRVKRTRVSRRTFLSKATAYGVAAAVHGSTGAGATPPVRVFVVPNFHPASCGWLTTFSKERVYCANSYLDHLDRVRDDPKYAFVLSEVNNIIAILNFQPDRFEELKKRVREGRVELANSFFLEPTINLSGGEALVKQGIEGLRWQQRMMGIAPRFAWTIDVCGTHDQMAQIASGLGLDAMVYTRKNGTGSTIHWWESPDGSRILSLCPGHYAELGEIFTTDKPLSPSELDEVKRTVDLKRKNTPDGAPVLVLAGYGDYALAPAYRKYPSELLEQWTRAYPENELRFATAGQYVDDILPGVKSGEIKIPTMRGGTEYDFNSFWIECPRVKSWYRRCEHGLLSAEMLATIASLNDAYEYPVQALHNAWILMMLNMDRNTLWGAAGGMVFESESSWDVRDRFEWVEKNCRSVTQAGLGAAGSGDGSAIAFFNPLNWDRTDPVLLTTSSVPAGVAAERIPGTDAVLCRPKLPSTGSVVHKTGGTAVEASRLDLLAHIETKYYVAVIDSQTGALVSLKVKPSGGELLGGAANVIVAEKAQKQNSDPGDFTPNAGGRTRVAATTQYKPVVRVTRGPLATTVVVESDFYGGKMCRRLMRFYDDYPRIDCEIDLEDIPDRTIVTAAFPLAEDVTEIRRGIPYGFSHGAWAKPNPELHGWTKGITPAVRWSDYAFAQNGGLALLDRGLSGREITGRTPVIFLYNATAKYYGYANPWLSGEGQHHLEYAIVPRQSDWAQARIPQLAWEYNCPPVVVNAPKPNFAARSFMKTSPNLIVEAMRRDRDEIEIRMAECVGVAGTGHVEISLPHRNAALTDLTGKRRHPIRGGPKYTFPLRPQQIVTLRLRAPKAVPDVRLTTKWDEFVPQQKVAALHAYSALKGHPPRGE